MTEFRVDRLRRGNWHTSDTNTYFLIITSHLSAPPVVIELLMLRTIGLQVSKFFFENISSNDVVSGFALASDFALGPTLSVILDEKVISNVHS